MTLGTEDSVYPAVFVGGEAHIVDIGGRYHIFRHRDGIIPETEVIHTVRTFRHGKERFAVSAFHTQQQQVFAIPLDGAGVERGIHADAFHQVGVGTFIQIIAPEDRGVRRRHYRIFVAGEDAVASLHGFILSRNQLLVFLKEFVYLIIKSFHIDCLFLIYIKSLRRSQKGFWDDYRMLRNLRLTPVRDRGHKNA